MRQLKVQGLSDASCLKSVSLVCHCGRMLMCAAACVCVCVRACLPLCACVCVCVCVCGDALRTVYGQDFGLYKYFNYYLSTLFEYTQLCDKKESKPSAAKYYCSSRLVAIVVTTRLVMHRFPSKRNSSRHRGLCREREKDTQTLHTTRHSNITDDQTPKHYRHPNITNDHMNVRDILYNTDVITSTVKLIVHSTVGKLV